MAKAYERNTDEHRKQDEEQIRPGDRVDYHDRRKDGRYGSFGIRDNLEVVKVYDDPDGVTIEAKLSDRANIASSIFSFIKRGKSTAGEVAADGSHI